MAEAHRVAFAAQVAALTTFKARQPVESLAASIVDAVVAQAIHQSTRDVSANADVTASVQQIVNELCVSITLACDSASYDRAVGALCAIDAAFRLTAEAHAHRASALAPSLSTSDAAALSEATHSVLAAELAAKVPAIFARLRSCAAIPEATAKVVESVARQWKKDKLLPVAVLEAIDKKRAPDAGTQAQQPPKAQPPPEGAAFVDLAAELPPLPKHVVDVRTRLVSDVLDVLSSLPPAVSARFWARMPAEAVIRDLAIESTASTQDATEVLQDVLAEAGAELARTKDALQAARGKRSGTSSGASASSDVPVIAAQAVLPARLLCDVRKPEVPQSREAPPVSKSVKESPYTAPHQTLPPGHVARRAWGLTMQQWIDEKDLASLPLVQTTFTSTVEAAAYSF